MVYLLSGFFGLIFGSFANVCIFRMPEDQSIAFPASHCPQCKNPIPARDNIPVLSYLFLHGRCRHCQKPISSQYPMVEACMGLLFLFNAWLVHDSVVALLLLDLFSFYLLTVSIIDFHHKIIPDELSLSLLVLGLVVAWWNPWIAGEPLARLIQSLAAAFLACAGMLFLAWAGEKIFKKEAMGGGDIKLVAAFGAFLGWNGAIGSMVIGSVIGGIVALGLLLARKKKRGESLPFGPFLCLGAYLACILPSEWQRLLFP